MFLRIVFSQFFIAKCFKKSLLFDDHHFSRENYSELFTPFCGQENKSQDIHMYKKPKEKYSKLFSWYLHLLASVHHLFFVRQRESEVN